MEKHDYIVIEFFYVNSSIIPAQKDIYVILFQFDFFSSKILININIPR